MVRRVLNWLSDTARFVGAMFYWNARKSLYVARGRRGRCPCQNESDDSVPGRVRCDAMVHWHQPVRFQKICPLLVATPDGWRCSVHAAQVRPYWGRVGVWCAATLLALYGAGVLAVFSALRTVGKAPVSLTQVAWPGKWKEIRRVQSDQLFRQAIAAFSSGRMNEAYLTLTTARQRDPANYDATLLLAQITMFQGSALFADAQFEALFREHPAQRSRTVVVYHDTLLLLDRMDKLAEFAVTMARADSARAAVWVRSALLAVRALPAGEAAAFREKSAGAIAALAPHAQRLLAAEFTARTGDAAGAARQLQAPFSGPLNPFYMTYQVQRLAELGDATGAQVLLDFYGRLLGDFDQPLVQYALSATARDTGAATVAFRRLLALPLDSQRVERLAAALITHPDAALFRELSARVQRERTLETASDGAGLWVAGIVSGAVAEAGYWQRHGRQPLAPSYPPIKAVDFTSRDIAVANSAGRLVNVLSLPREVILALFGRVVPQDEAGRHARPTSA